MPIHCPIEVHALSDMAFRALDYRVMRQVFDVHNTLGRFCDEAVCRTDLSRSLQKAGIVPLHAEVPVTVSFQTFRKRYHIDLLIAAGSIYELKATAAFDPSHRAQTLNYLLLLGLSHGKLVNLRPPSVTWEFVTTRLTQRTRREFGLLDERWKPVCAKCGELREWLVAILEDWGAYLELALYLDALTWFLGGEQMVVRGIELHHQGTRLGRQHMHLLTPDIAFRLTAFSDGLSQAEVHLRRLLALTPLRALHWINLHQADIALITLVK